MRRGVIAAALAVALGLAALWVFGGFDALAEAAVAAQREAQGRMAGALRALRAGQPGALAGLIGLGFAYGFLHAAGPGHGKVLIGAYGLARPVGLTRLMAISLAASLAQALVAVGLVYAGLLILGWGRDRMTGLADGLLAQAGTVAILLIGLWLLGRGLLALWRCGAGGHDHHDHHGHDHHGHAHMPDPAAIARATGPAEVAALIAAVAMRPCTGALFLLIVTWQMGIAAAGIAATLAMGLGTFATVVAVVLIARLLRRGALSGLAGSRLLALGLPVLEIGAGAVVVLTTAAVLARGY